ncbi:hypothetical protein P3S67_016270 [Capsicum chacoense]
MNFIDRFPLLEKLIIDGCSMMEYLNVSQQNLTNLVLYDCFVTREVRINSPKLKSLEYKGGFTFFEGIEALQELEFVELYLDPLKFRDYWYSWIRNILELCSHSKHLSLICGIEEDLILTNIRNLTREDDVKVFSEEVAHNPKSDRRVCFLRIKKLFELHINGSRQLLLPNNCSMT